LRNKAKECIHGHRRERTAPHHINKGTQKVLMRKASDKEKKRKLINWKNRSEEKRLGKKRSTRSKSEEN